VKKSKAIVGDVLNHQQVNSMYQLSNPVDKIRIAVE